MRQLLFSFAALAREFESFCYNGNVHRVDCYKNPYILHRTYLTWGIVSFKFREKNF